MAEVASRGPRAAMPRGLSTAMPRGLRPHAQEALFWVMCAGLPVAVLAALSAWVGVYPFGPESFLADDLKYQYIDFFAWFRRVLTGEADIFYSFAQGMGSNTWGLYSYYLASPFNLIILLFDESRLTLAIYAIVALKLACMNISMTWYLRRRFSLRRSWALALAICYTWSTWTATNVRNPLWLDALILLPLMAWCCRRLVRDGSFLGLGLLIAVDIMACWYMAYITLLFCCLLFLLELAAVLLAEDMRVPRSWMAGRGARFTAAVILGLALSAWTFIPTVLAMRGGAPGRDILVFQTDIPRYFLGFLPGTWVNGHSPQFYTGLIPLALALAMLGCKRIDPKLRKITFGFAAFIGASSLIGVLMAVWCGFRQPNGFYCRIAFLLSFLEIWAAAYLLGIHGGSPQRAGRIERIVRRCARSAGLGILALAFVLADMGWNAHQCWVHVYADYPQSAHEAYVRDAARQINQVKARERRAFFRIDKTYNRMGAAFNEGLSQEFNQLSTYSSANSPKAVAFLNALGYSSPGEFSSVYASPNLLMDSLLGVRYIGTWETPPGAQATGIAPSLNGAGVWLNSHALSLGFASAHNLANSPIPIGSDPFERQNTLMAGICAESTPLYTPVSAEEMPADGAGLSWEVNIPAGSVGYAFVERGPDAGSFRPVSLTIDGSAIEQEGWRFANNVRALGPASQTPQTHTVTLQPCCGQEQMPAGTTCIFYALDMTVFENAMRALSSSQFEPTVFEDGHVAGSYRAQGDTHLLLSIPYDEGWSVTVDGRASALSPALGGGMSTLALAPGNHDIEMTYRSPGLSLGCALSAGAAVIYAVLAIASRHRGANKR